MFFGREKELKELNALYLTRKFQMPVIYGRRRIGKTALITEFVKDKKVIFYSAVEKSKKLNIENFGKTVLSVIDKHNEDLQFSNFMQILERVFAYSIKNQIILVIDEFPYLAKSDKSFSSILQSLIDKYEKKSKLYLILCGSSMSFMERTVFGYKAPLYGRRTAQIKLKEFDFFEMKKIFTKMSIEDLAKTYGTVGGTPKYFLQFSDKLNYEQNVKESFLKTSAFLYEETKNLLKQEVRDEALYNAIIYAIAKGSTKISEIATKVGSSIPLCNASIKNLISLDLVERQIPFGERKSKKSIYRLTNNMFRFYYAFVLENVSNIERGFSDDAYDSIKPYIDNYMGKVFEEICISFLWKMKSAKKISFIDIGRWWGTNSKIRKEVEIDIMGTINKESALFCECKWHNELVSLSVYQSLVDKASMFNYKNKEYYIFAKKGFTEKLKNEERRDKNLHLITYKEMFLN
ncbi:MAG: ATP-binding protein [Lachnospiraceae bacterium]|nr:ATP-binding protein [Lachnospiraceae bacterium]